MCMYVCMRVHRWCLFILLMPLEPSSADAMVSFRYLFHFVCAYVRAYVGVCVRVCLFFFLFIFSFPPCLSFAFPLSYERALSLSRCNVRSLFLCLSHARALSLSVSLSPGAINGKQLAFLQNYKRKSKKDCIVM